MPLHDLARVSVEPFQRRFGGGRINSHHDQSAK
jgi:hypothetical protein